MSDTSDIISAFPLVSESEIEEKANVYHTIKERIKYKVNAVDDSSKLFNQSSIHDGGRDLRAELIEDI